MDKNHVMYKLFHSFESNNIAYLHFKSNTNLDASFAGKGDFDVLVDKSEILKIESLISEHNGKRHNPVHVGSYAGVDNWLVFDECDGKIYHLHLHYQLVTGKKFVKDYVIPWNEILFSTRVKDPDYDIYVTNPNVELLLLTFRIVLKSKFFDYYKKLLGVYRLEKSMQREWDDMTRKSSRDKVEELLGTICPNYVSEMTALVTKPKLSSYDYFQLHRYVRQCMKIHRRYTGFEATAKTIVYQAEDLFYRIWNKLFDGLAIRKKISLQGGLIIAFVGVDGAGKSTVSNEISKWFGKIEAKRFYMGTGDGKTTLLASCIKKLIQIHGHGTRKSETIKNPQKRNLSSVDSSSPYSHPIKFLKSYLRVRMISSVQKNNYKKIQRMHRYRLNGGICVLDRWPQVEIPKQNDGPKIIEYAEKWGWPSLLKNKVEKESSHLGIVKIVKPDIIFRLNISLDTCMSRKPEHIDRAFFEKKMHELKQITFQRANIIEIDAEQPYNEELLLIKKILWKYV